MNDPGEKLRWLWERIRVAEAARAPSLRSAGPVRLLAVSKTRSAAEIRALALHGQRAFGENYVQEALAKRRELDDPSIAWHLIGHLQSNKAREAAVSFDWVQTVDRPRLVAALARHRPDALPPLNVLVQVNVDDEPGKSGCDPSGIAALAVAVAGEPRLVLRGLMAIPAPDPDMQRRRAAFRAMRKLFDALRASHPSVDTLSIGMSEDFELAIDEGANLVRIGTAMFGARREQA
jgi:pyridoxal phosphate enzyme (YggS family)